MMQQLRWLRWVAVLGLILATPGGQQLASEVAALVAHGEDCCDDGCKESCPGPCQTCSCCPHPGAFAVTSAPLVLLRSFSEQHEVVGFELSGLRSLHQVAPPVRPPIT
jgi:hypothetical protein